MGAGAAGHVVLAERVVEVLHNQGDDASPQWSSGSGFIMRGALVLTAAHVVRPAGELLVRFRGVEERPARVCTLPDGGLALDDQLDLAVLEILDTHGDAPAVAVARLRDNPTLDVPNLDGCVAFGFPAFEQRTRPGRDRPVRESVRVDGYIPMGQGAVEGLATLRIRDAPQHPSITPGDLSRSPWRGISGAVVFAGAVAIGVISEHHPPAGLNGLTVVPLAWIDRRADAAAWWDLLGVADPASLPSLPAAPDLASPDAEVERRYRELLLRSPEFTRLPTPFEALSPAFYMPRLLRAADAATDGDDPVRPVTDVMTSVHRLVIFAPAGMGKTELLHDLMRRMAGDGDGIPVFVRLHDLARRGEGHDLLNFAIIESFGDLVDHAEVEQIVAMLRRRREQDVSDVVFLFDGLDEVPVARLNDVLARVRKVDRFVLTSRPSGRIDVLQDGPAYWIDGLNDEAVGHFVDRWESRDPDVRNLLDRLAEDPRLGELAQFPQLLVLLCWLWRPVSAGGQRSRVGIIATAVDEAFSRAVRLASLPDGSEEVVPAQARDALQRAALEAVSTGEGDRMDLSRRHLLTFMEEAGGRSLAALLLGFARRTGLLVPAPAGDDLRFLHQAFRAHLAGEALVAADDPAPAVDRLALRKNGDDTLAAAAALEPERMAALILDRLAACREDLFRMNSRSAAVCLEGLTDLRPLDERLRPVADAVLEGAREVWSRDWFAPAIGYLRTDYMRTRLRDSLADDDGDLRWAAVEGLRHMGEPEAVRPLVDRLPDEPWPGVQTAIVVALGRLRDPAAVGPLWAHYERLCRAGVRRGASIELRAIGESLGRLDAEPQIRSLIDRLGDDEEGALEVLMGARPFVPPHLSDEITRSLTAARVILTDPEDVLRYLATADDPAATTAGQLEAIDGLGAVGTGEAADAILRIMLTATTDEVRERAGAALRDLEGETGFADVVQHLANVFWSPDPASRHEGALAFLLLWTSPAQDALAAMTFPEPGQQDEELAQDADSRVRATVAIMACLAGWSPLELLAELAGDQDALVRETAVAALGWLPGDDGTDPVVRRAVRDTEYRVRIAALRALGRLAPAGAADVVGMVLDSDQADERAEAAAALRAVGDGAAMAPILRRLRAEEDPTVRWALVDAAIELSRPDPVPSDVAKAIGTELKGDTAARAFGARAAGRAGLVETSAQLRELMRSDPDDAVRGEAARSYGRVAAPDALLRLVDELTAGEPPRERLSALADALSYRSRDVVDGLVARIAEAGGHTIVTERATVVKYRIHTHTLMSSSDPRGVATLLEALSSPDAGDRWNAVDELEDRWHEPGVLGRIAVAMLDPDICVADRAAGIIDDLADTYEPAAMDEESRALLGHPDTLTSLIELLEPDSEPVYWLLMHVEFMPALLRAEVGGAHAVRPLLWYLADHHGVRLFPDGTAVLATGREVRWDDLPGALR
jgi:HEAT repeat protein